jgi:hypothetical protein
MDTFGNLVELITYHLHLHKGVELRDIYKLIHQSVFGPEHLGAGASERAILEESNSPGVEFEEPLLEPISVDASACRLNLRVARTRGIAPPSIAQALRRSAGKFSRSPDELDRLWEEVGNSLKGLSGGFGREDYEKLTRLVSEKDFPPLHHSGSYRKYNRPAYRVLVREEAGRLMPLLPGDALSP